MQAQAKLRHLRISPRKVRLVAATIRGLDVQVAEDQLRFLNKKAARPLLKLLRSAVANAENNFKLKANNLYIHELRVDAGPTLKRWTPRAFGRASAINKRTSHITLILEEKIKTKPKPTKKTAVANKDQDVKIVKNLEELKELESQMDNSPEDKKRFNQKSTKPTEHPKEKEIKDIHREGSDRSSQHLDTVRKKGRGGALKKVFRRKSI